MLCYSNIIITINNMLLLHHYYHIIVSFQLHHLIALFILLTCKPKMLKKQKKIRKVDNYLSHVVNIIIPGKHITQSNTKSTLNHIGNAFDCPIYWVARSTKNDSVARIACQCLDYMIRMGIQVIHSKCEPIPRCSWSQIIEIFLDESADSIYSCTSFSTNFERSIWICNISKNSKEKLNFSLFEYGSHFSCCIAFKTNPKSSIGPMYDPRCFI